MKRILLLFLLIIFIYLIFTKVNFHTWLPLGGQATDAPVTDRTDNITINVSGVNAEIIPQNRNNLSAELKGTGTVKVQKLGDSITVTYKRNWFEWVPFNEKKLTIYIPSDYSNNMGINIGSGNVNLGGQASSPMKLNNLNLNIGSGNLHVKNLDVNHLQDHSGSGNTNIERMTAKIGSFEISSGNVTVKHYQGQLKTRLSSGNFQAEFDKLNNSIDVVVSSGSVKLDLPENANFTLNGKVSSGMISNDFKLKNEKRDRGYLQGVHGSGKYDVDLTVSSGRISIY